LKAVGVEERWGDRKLGAIADSVGGLRRHMYKQLVPLRIPSGWAIVHNSFGDVDPVICDGVIANNEFYNEDLLSIESILFDGESWATDKSGYLLDVGWYPDSDPQGSYRLTLLRGGWDNIIAELKSIEREKIREWIEVCLDLILQGIEGEALLRLINSA
jgi:hypothetical protein